MRPLEAHELAFPYRKPYDSLPWQPIQVEQDLPLDEWVWVADRLHNIYPAARTGRGLEVPAALSLPAMQRTGLLETPRFWLPFTPERLTVLIGQRLPSIVRAGRPGHG